MKRWIALVLTVLMALTLLSPPFQGLAETITATPLMEQTTPADGMIRVWLSSIRNNTTVYNLTLTGSYTMDGQQLSSGSKVRVEFSGGTVLVNGAAKSNGVTLSRQSGGVKIAEALAPGNTYPGDMSFFYAGGTAYAVCKLYIEDYICGVLPYEMDNSFPLEALKAQAVTARTYAIRAKTSGGSYDVTDTTTHQVFRGVNYDKARCIQAVKDTWGVILRYDEKYVGAYYSASNGGQTEGNTHVWGGAALAYLPIKDDPYDLSNTKSTQKSYLVYTTPSQGTSTSGFSMIQTALANKLGGSASAYEITEITDMKLHTPKYPDPSKLYTVLAVTVRAGGSSTTVDIPIFPTVESTLGLSINNGSNELYSVVKEDKGFRITARRFGHGVGMSQRGAEQMGTAGYSYGQILGFYYENAQRVRMNFTSLWPDLSPTPPRVEDPSGIVEETLAKVSLASASDRLNLRKTADAQSEILAKLENGTEVTILGTTGSWNKIRYGQLVGYVSRQYLVVTASPTPAPSTGAAGTAQVSLESGSLNLRETPSESARGLGTIPNGATVDMVEKGTTWSRIRYNNQTGYVMTLYLSIAASATAAPTSKTVTVKLSGPNETLNLRKEPSVTAQVLRLVRHGTELSLIARGDEWTEVNYQGSAGFAMTKYLSFSADDPTPTPTATPAPSGSQMATVTLKDGMLNLRDMPNGSAKVVTKMPNRARVTVTQVGDTWYGVTYAGKSGYAMREYLVLDTPVTPSQAPVSPTTAPTLAPNASAAWVITSDGDRANLRRTASTGGTVLDRLPSGTEVVVLEKGDSWTRVQYGTFTGYIATQYLSAVKPGSSAATNATTPTQAPTQPPADTQTIGDAKTTVLNSGRTALNSVSASLHLRAQANDLAQTIGLLSQGEDVEVLQYVGSDATWIYVRKGTVEGYALRSFFKLGDPIAKVTLTDTTTKLSVRASGSSSAKVVTSLSHNALVTVLGKSNGWARIRIGDGTTGYVSQDFLREL